MAPFDVIVFSLNKKRIGAYKAELYLSQKSQPASRYKNTLSL
jgi:hypothetical protein